MAKSKIGPFKIAYEIHGDGANEMVIGHAYFSLVEAHIIANLPILLLSRFSICVNADPY